jgi:hypothetical protein
MYSASNSSNASGYPIGHQKSVHIRRKHNARHPIVGQRDLSAVDDDVYSSNYKIYQSSNPPSSSQKSSGKQRSQVPIDGFIYQVSKA